MSTLAVTWRRIESLHNGYDLRVANLCAQLPGPVHLVVVPLEPGDAGSPDTAPSIRPETIFADVDVAEPLLGGRRALRRHLRTTDDRFLELAVPERLAAARDRLCTAFRERDATHLVAFGGELAELVAPLGPANTILDICDSRTLTARRAIEGSAERPGRLRRIGARTALHRMRATESRLPDRFAYVTAISDADAREIAGLHGSARNVRTIPNGVAERFLAPLPAPGRRRAVVFWGNLGFPPNTEALRFFVHRVHLPMLAPAGVGLHVVGAEAPRWLRQLAGSDNHITLAGFVDDLAAEVGPYPIMINPMRTGSGLKNKVLEAFGLGLAVVTTPLGVEALPGVRAGVHAVAATSAADLGSAVLELLADETRRDALRRAANALLHERYRWDVVGREWRALFHAGEPARAGGR